MPTNNELLNAQGVNYGAMNGELAQATEQLALTEQTPQVIYARKKIDNVQKLLTQSGLFNQAIWDALNNSPTPTPVPVPEPTPEPVDPDFTGKINVFQLSPIDLAFYHQQAMGNISGFIFSGNRTILNQWIARDYEESKAVTGAMLVNYNGVLKQFQGKTPQDFQ